MLSSGVLSSVGVDELFVPKVEFTPAKNDTSSGESSPAFTLKSKVVERQGEVEHLVDKNLYPTGVTVERVVIVGMSDADVARLRRVGCTMENKPCKSSEQAGPEGWVYFRRDAADTVILKKPGVRLDKTWELSLSLDARDPDNIEEFVV